MTYSEWKALEEEPGSENRRYPRLACGGIADLRVIPDGNKESGCLVNLSKRGCCFLADEPLLGSKGSTIEVHLKVKGIDLRVAGVIRHIHKYVRAGIEFVSLSERKCEQIDELIAELTEMDRLAAAARGRKQVPKPRVSGRYLTVAEQLQREQPVEDPVLRNLLRFYRD